MTVPGEALPESRFTEPTKLCAHPEWWTATDSESTEREVAELVYGLVRGLQPDLCLETGTAFGEVTEKISDALYANGHGFLVTIEIDPERTAYTQKRLSECAGGRTYANVMFETGDSRSWEPHGVIDFAWFDSHFSLRVPEFRHYRPSMRKGTIVCFHDTAPGHGSARLQDPDLRGIISRALERELRLIHLPTPRGLTIGEVR